MRKAVVRETDGLVVNVVEIEFPTSWTPPEGTYCIDANGASSGDTWDGVRFVKPILSEPKPVKDPLAELEARVAALEER